MNDKMKDKEMDAAAELKNEMDKAAGYDSIARASLEAGNYDRALEYYQKALDIRERVLGKNHPDTAGTYNNIATAHHDKGDDDRALEYYVKALAIFERVLGPDHPDTAQVYHNLGVEYEDKGFYDWALEYYQKALTVREKQLGKDHPDTVETHNSITRVRAKAGSELQSVLLGILGMAVLLAILSIIPNLFWSPPRKPTPEAYEEAPEEE